MRPVALLLAFAALAAAADVRVWQATLTLPTYQEGAPNPNPPFDLFATNRFNYPYTLRETITDQKKNEAWRAVFLENEYLKCSVLPDIGGHLYTCIDKVSGQPMFYANPSIKKAQIGMRGAWAAFGIEFNFPVSHNWMSMSPVNSGFARHTDGSASVTVGNVDLVYGMEWSVELTLRPASMVLEEKVVLSNRSDVRHRFYWWNNAAVQVWDDSKIEYPMRYAASHGFTEVQSWPVDPSGKDLSIIRNQTDGPVSLFVHGSREPFMGVWNPHSNTGTVHYAEYSELPAKKIWSWGVDADGLDWRRTLSDNNSAYVEIQGGLFRNQETYAFLQPRTTIQFSEYWMPVRDTGGIARANLNGVLNLSRSGNDITAALNVNHAIPNAQIRIACGDRILATDKESLKPETTWKREVASAAKCTFELRDANENILLAHTEGEYDWTPANEIRTGPQPAFDLPAPEHRTDGDWLRAGEQQELDGELLKALATYQTGLKTFPESFSLQKAAGRLAASLLRYSDAVSYLEPVSARSTTDPEIAYYLGLAYEGLQHDEKARFAFEAAHRLPEFRAAAALHLGELAARRHDLGQAQQFLQEAHEAQPQDVRTIEELAAVRGLVPNPPPQLSYFLQDVSGKPDLSALASDPARVLSIAAEYMRLGMYERALQALDRKYPDVPQAQREPGSVLPQQNILIAYYRAFCNSKLNRSAAANYAEAEKVSTTYIFPSGPETLTVLRTATELHPDDAKAHYLLGTELFSIGLVDQALEEWNRAGTLNSNIPVLHADIGNALLFVRDDPKAAAAAFLEGFKSDPYNPALYTGIDQALSLLRSPPSERVQALERYPDRTNMPAALVYELALNLAEAGDVDKAIALFHNRFFPREEGGTNVRQIWVEVRLQQALDLTRNGHCDAATHDAGSLGEADAALPFTQNGLNPFLHAARTEYLLGSLFRECGKAEDAAQHFRNAEKQNGLGDVPWAYKAAQVLDPHIDWGPRLTEALARAKVNAKTSSYSGLWDYIAGEVAGELGNRQTADSLYHAALLAPDRMMSHHLSRLALAVDSSRTITRKSTS